MMKTQLHSASPRQQVAGCAQKAHETALQSAWSSTQNKEHMIHSCLSSSRLCGAIFCGLYFRNIYVLIYFLIFKELFDK